MIGALKKLFETPPAETEEARQRRMRLAAAALLIETARADFTQDASEEAALRQLLSSSLQLEPAAVQELLQAASAQLDESTSLYEFTRVINDCYSAEQKRELIGSSGVLRCSPKSPAMLAGGSGGSVPRKPLMPSGSSTSSASPSASFNSRPAAGDAVIASTAEGTLPRVVLEGEWSGADDFHFAEGRALIIETAPGAYTLRVEDFSVRNGPDLFVYVSPDPLGYSPEAVKLGALKATDGAFNYEIPSDVPIESIRSAVVWCDAFAVLFGSAPLE